MELHDTLTGETFSLDSHVVVNACGPYSDALCRLDDEDHEDRLRPSQGIHLVFDAKVLQGGDALLIPKTDDGRVLFAVPWLGKVLVGTTDTAIDRVDAEPLALESEIDFVLDHANRFLGLALKRVDIRSVFAGLRPLIQGRRDNTAKLSRSHEVEGLAQRARQRARRQMDHLPEDGRGHPALHRQTRPTRLRAGRHVLPAPRDVPRRTRPPSR